MQQPELPPTTICGNTEHFQVGQVIIIDLVALRHASTTVDGINHSERMHCTNSRSKDW